MASTAEKREWWADWRCDTSRMVRVEFPGDKRTWNLLVADTSAPAWETFAGLMRKHDYPFREAAGGTYNCRQITGGTAYSLHAYGIALDLNPSKNPYGTQRHDFPQGFIDDVAATGLFRWGIEFDDPMHWEIDVPPDQILEDPMDPELLEFLKDMYRSAVEERGSNGTALGYMVDHLRNHPAGTGITAAKAREIARDEISKAKVRPG